MNFLAKQQACNPFIWKAKLKFSRVVEYLFQFISMRWLRIQSNRLKVGFFYCSLWKGYGRSKSVPVLEDWLQTNLFFFFFFFWYTISPFFSSCEGLNGLFFTQGSNFEKFFWVLYNFVSWGCNLVKFHIKKQTLYIQNEQIQDKKRKKEYDTSY